MNTWLVTAAAAAVRGWTWLYTLPLDADARNVRRDEIQSDVWELRNDRHVTSGWLAAHLVIRAALGVPDDLLWICEQAPDHLRPPRLFMVFRFAIVVVAASGLAVSASGPSLDLHRTLRVNIASTGWLGVASGRTESMLVPAFAFTLTNIGDRPTGALQVNALFYLDASKQVGFGTAFSSAVGWHGLTAGSTSRSLVLRAPVWNVFDASVKSPPAAILQPGISEAHVRLFVKHAARWTFLGEYPIRAQLMP
jgi:hypothetical protein